MSRFRPMIITTKADIIKIG